MSGPAPPVPPVPRLLAISDRRSLPPETTFEAWLRLLADALLLTARRRTDALLAVQIREKDLDDRRLLELVRRGRELLPETVPVLVNGRPDVALAAGADGVHLPAAGLPVAAVRRCAEAAGRPRPRPFLVGRSTHAAEEVAVARGEGADYVTFGPVHPTPSKAAYGPPPGLEGLAAAVRAAGGLPVIALGGVTPERLPPLAAAGAHGAAAIRAFQEAGSALAMLRGAGPVR